MKAVPYIQNKRDDYKLKLSYPKNNYCTGAHSQYKRKEKNNCENDFSPPPPPPPPPSFLPKRKNTFTNIDEVLCPLQEHLF